jgi:hypothetical protein
MHDVSDVLLVLDIHRCHDLCDTEDELTEFLLLCILLLLIASIVKKMTEKRCFATDWLYY